MIETWEIILYALVWVATAIAVYISDKARKRTKVLIEKADFKKWDLVQEFSLMEAACLWVEVEPDPKHIEEGGIARKQYLKLLDAVIKGELTNEVL